jgi:iron complex outermembrane receptor protein
MSEIHKLCRAFLLVSASTLAAGTSGIAYAQNADPAPAIAASPAANDTGGQSGAAATLRASGGLDEIIVTARRRIESLQDVPVSVTALSAERLSDYSLTDIGSVASLTPQFQVGTSAVGSGAQLTLRGIGSNSSSVGIEQSVAVIVDGAYYGDGRVINEGFFDLGELQLLKGPQALFFGKNATAGVISISTANPTYTPEHRSTLGYEIGAQRLYGEQIFSGPLSDTLSGRIALRFSNMFEGYTKNLATPQPFTTRDVTTGETRSYVAPAVPSNTPQAQELIGRVTLQWEPSDALTANLKFGGTINKVNDSAWNNNIFSCPGGFSQIQPDVACRPEWFSYHNKMPAEIAAVFPLAGDGDLRSDYRSLHSTGTVNYDLGGATVTAILNYQQSKTLWAADADYQQRVTQIWVTDRDYFRGLSGELRAQTDFDGVFNAMAGVLFQDTRRTLDQNVFNANLEDSTKAPEDRYVAFGKESFTDGRTISPYGQVTLDLLDTVELTGGVRYTHETKDSQFVQDTTLQPNIYVVGSPVTANQTFNNWSPEATLLWKITPQLSVYGAYKTAYKSGGFSNSSALLRSTRPQDLSFGPEKARGFEVGVKGTLLDNQMRFELTGYTFTYEDLQIDFFNGQTFAFVTTNAGSARTKGIEFSAQYAPYWAGDLQMNGSINYNHSRYTDFLAPCYTGQSRDAGCNTSAFGGLGQDLSGTPTSVAPEWTGAIGADYKYELSNALTGKASFNIRYSDDYLGSPFGNPFSQQENYIAVDAFLRVINEDAGLELALIGKNLTNEFWISGALDASGTGFGTGTNNARPSDQRGFANSPRTVQLQATLRY